MMKVQNVIGILVAQTAHVPDVLRIGLMILLMVQRIVHRMDHGTGPEKESGLEHGMGDEVEEPVAYMRRRRAPSPCSPAG